jgi:NAD(P)-dependent dehydrogenase (short-subunit alcohol dehydrogenase family)
MKQSALITGGSRGIGLGIASELARAGFDLVINGVRNENGVADVLKELAEYGVAVHYIRGDISRPEDRLSIFLRTLEMVGKLNLLVNNAGVAPLERTDIMETTEESYDRVMGINLKGPFFLTQLFASHMTDQKKMDAGFKACVINISSVSATVASTNRGEYCVSKAGISMATKLWAARLGEYDIPVYEIQPGIIKTDMTGAVREKYDRMIDEGICVQKRWGEPEDVGRVAVAMATGLMPYSTGQVVMVDGGLTIPRL